MVGRLGGLIHGMMGFLNFQQRLGCRRIRDRVVRELFFVFFDPWGRG